MTTLKLDRFVHQPVAASQRTLATVPGTPFTRWAERLAAWADRQPRHHHLGRWTTVWSMPRR